MHLVAIHAHVRAVAEVLGQPRLAALADHGARVRGLVAAIPREAWHKVETTVTTKYQQLEERYGRPMAVAIVSAGILGTAVPLPGTTIVAAAPLIGLAELHHRLSATTDPAAGIVENFTIAESEIHNLGNRWIEDLAKLFGQRDDIPETS